MYNYKVDISLRYLQFLTSSSQPTFSSPHLLDLLDKLTSFINLLFSCFFSLFIIYTLLFLNQEGWLAFSHLENKTLHRYSVLYFYIILWIHQLLLRLYPTQSVSVCLPTMHTHPRRSNWQSIVFRHLFNCR